VKTRLKKTYFDPERYYQKMRQIWEAKVTAPGWGTIITEVKPNNIMISGYALQQIVGRKGLLDVANLLIEGEFAAPELLKQLRITAIKAALQPEPSIVQRGNEDISQTLARALSYDEVLTSFPQKGRSGPGLKTAFALGRFGRYLAAILRTTSALDGLSEESSFTELMYRAITGDTAFDRERGDLLEAMAVACVDHGVTPPSAQVAIISASTRANYAVSIASGIGAITDVHGGAGTKAALFFSECVSRSKKNNLDLEDATKIVVAEYVRAGRRIEGLGHRIHTQDPRRDVLWKLSEVAGIAGENIAVSKIVSEAFKQVRGMDLPINVDGVIGAIVADMGLKPIIAKALFIWGRVAGLSSHYFEEILSQPEMRSINFAEAVYNGKPNRELI
jgi:citrate synthase